MQATRQTTWRPIPGFEGRYEVSDDGQVKALAVRFKKDRILKGWRDRHGYWLTSLHYGDDKRRIQKRVHVLVLEAFVGPRPEGAYGLHYDDDRNNNHVDNLRWGNQSVNMQDMIRNGHHNNARKTYCKHGHPLSGDNLTSKVGERECRACRIRRQSEYHARKRASRG